MFLKSITTPYKKSWWKHGLSPLTIDPSKLKSLKYKLILVRDGMPFYNRNSSVERMKEGFALTVLLPIKIFCNSTNISL
jgi:hypothetical protein